MQNFNPQVKRITYSDIDAIIESLGIPIFEKVDGDGDEIMYVNTIATEAQQVQIKKLLAELFPLDDLEVTCITDEWPNGLVVSRK